MRILRMWMWRFDCIDNNGGYNGRDEYDLLIEKDNKNKTAAETESKSCKRANTKRKTSGNGTDLREGI